MVIVFLDQNVRVSVLSQHIVTSQVRTSGVEHDFSFQDVNGSL